MKRACDSCHKKKIHCFKVDPEPWCHECMQHDVACTFDRTRGRQKNGKTRRSKSSASSPGQRTKDNLSQRLTQLQNAIARLVARRDGTRSPSREFLLPMTPSSNTISGASSVNTESPGGPMTQEPVKPGPDNIYAPTEASYGQFHFAGHYIGYLSCNGGLPSFTQKGLEWISSRTGGVASCSRLVQLGAEHQMPSRTLTYNLPVIDRQGYFNLSKAMPDRSISESLLRDFKGSVFGIVFPVIDQVLFIDTLDLAYQPNDGRITVERITSTACVLAFLSVAFFFRSESADDTDIDTALCAAMAHRFLSGLQKEMSITSLQTVLFLHFHQLLRGNMNLASKLLAAAYRMTISMGGHVNLPANSTEENLSREDRETRLLRTIFWLCYVLDKDVALRTGRPPIFPDELFNLTLPDGYENLHIRCQSGWTPETTHQPLHETQIPTFPGDIRLSTLKGKISRSLYSMSAPAKTEAELLRDVRELDEELEHWRKSLPMHCRPALSIPNEFQLASSWKLDESVRHIFLHLEYHHLITAIHQASAKCPLGPENNDASRSGDLVSSLTLSTEASRSTLVYFKAAIAELADESLWLIIFYPISALLTIFCNILANPLDPQAKPDIELLRATAQLIKAMPRRRLALYGTRRIDSIIAFVDELIQLGNSAIIYQRNGGGGFV
ncbi:hypothetical protein LCI18_015188 [Fusarium solani-melongenae]|uniref:Uncharacterized protein n=1 Tax=Fusarium solani subsp. cucurbitae TaxID=2747967 RepID=A0ACD3ZTS5_FUSSC|nr:hypothetical protein LCI18_015188 [Fusarium solani-melongenae]